MILNVMSTNVADSFLDHDVHDGTMNTEEGMDGDGHEDCNYCSWTSQTWQKVWQTCPIVQHQVIQVSLASRVETEHYWTALILMSC